MGFKKERLLNDLLSKPSSTSNYLQKSCTSAKGSPVKQMLIPISHHNAKTESEGMGLSDAAKDKDEKPSDLELNDNATGLQTPHDEGCGTDNHTENINCEDINQRRLESDNSNCVREASLSRYLDCADANYPVPLSPPDEKTEKNNEINTYQEFNQIDSLEVPEKEVEIHSTAGNSSCSNSHQDIDNTRDPSKLSTVISNVVPLPIDYNIDSNQSNTVDMGRPSREGIGVKPHSDHDYCFENSIHGISSQDQSYAYCPSEFSAASPSITWGLEYRPTYQLHPYQTYSTSSVDMVQLNSSSCWYFNVGRKGDLLKKIGLTQVDLEQFADTGNFSESLFSRGKSRSSEQRSSRVKVRREVFIDAMQDIGDHKKIRNHKKKILFNHANLGNNDNIMLEKWRNIDELGVEEMHCFLEEITEIMYRIKGTQQKQLLADQSNMAWHVQEKGERNQIQCHVASTNTQIHQKIRMRFAKCLASKQKRSNVEWKLDDRERHTNPPVWERSRSVTNVCNKKSSMTSLPTKHSPIATSATKNVVGQEESPTNVTEKCKQAKHVRKSREVDTERTLRSRTITLPTSKRKEAPKKTQGKQTSYKEKTDCNPAPPPDDVSSDSNTHQLQSKNILSSREWTTLSEKWINNPLDKTAMLQTLNDDKDTVN